MTLFWEGGERYKMQFKSEGTMVIVQAKAISQEYNACVGKNENHPKLSLCVSV